MSKPNLPLLSQMDVGVSGQVKFAYSQDALIAYAEEAVRQALAAQAAALRAFADRKYCVAIEYARRDEALGWESKAKNGRFGADEYACHKSMNEAYGAHFGIYEALRHAAIIPDDSPGHKPAPVDTSLGHSAPVAGEALTAEAVERQYRDGVHIGSGLPRATCPCGFCAKHRHGFERGDDLAAPQASDQEA